MKPKLWIVASALVLLIAACQPGDNQFPTPQVVLEGPPQCWIDYPPDGVNIPPYLPQVTAHATSPKGILRFDFFVNGAAEHTFIAGGKTLEELIPPGLPHVWHPLPDVPSYLLAVRAWDSQGTSCLAEVHVYVGQQSPAPLPTVPLVAVPTPILPRPPGPVPPAPPVPSTQPLPPIIALTPTRTPTQRLIIPPGLINLPTQTPLPPPR
jgi:hypothetical protein